MKDMFNYLEQLNFSNSYIVVAVSGGPDSMALLDILNKYRKYRNFKIVCAHVNHNKRVESAKEAQILYDYCKKNSIIFEYMEIKEYSNKNFENEAREKRYCFFESLINKYNSKYLFTAHHGDDLIETILMRIVRGSNLKGYIGFTLESSRDNYTIIRPLLKYTKEDLIKYVESNNVCYSIDKSNFEDIHTRNRYRKYVLPCLKSEEANVHLKFLKFSNEISECNDFVEKYSKDIYSKIVVEDKMDISLFLVQEEIIKKNILCIMLNRVYGNLIVNINNRHIDNIMKFINGKNGYIDLPNDFKAIKEYNNFYISKLYKVDNYEYLIDGFVLLPNGKKISVLTSCNDTDNNVIYLNSNQIKLPLKVRNRRLGDRISVKNMNGTKKVNDVFIDMKISNVERESWPIVVDSNNETLWLPGLKKSKFDRQKDKKYDIILKYS